MFVVCGGSDIDFQKIVFERAKNSFTAHYICKQNNNHPASSQINENKGFKLVEIEIINFSPT